MREGTIRSTLFRVNSVWIAGIGVLNLAMGCVFLLLDKDLFANGLMIMFGGTALLIASPTTAFANRVASPEAAVRTFLWAALSGHRRVWDSLVALDRDATPRMATRTFFGPLPSLGSPFDDPTGFARYWLYVRGYLTRHARVTTLITSTKRIADDLVAVECDVNLTEIKRGNLLAAAGIVAVGSAAFVAAIGGAIAVQGNPWMILAIMAIGFGFLGGAMTVSWVIALSVIGGKRTKTLRTRKLAVRVNSQWRIFCGEFEGAEEKDLSWLPSE
jgi:hypothetical protein